MSEQRRSTRIAAQPKKEEAPKPAAKPRKQPNKRPAAEEGTDAVEEKEKPATKKVRVFVDVSFVVRCLWCFVRSDSAVFDRARLAKEMLKMRLRRSRKVCCSCYLRHLQHDDLSCHCQGSSLSILATPSQP